MRDDDDGWRAAQPQRSRSRSPQGAPTRTHGASNSANDTPDRDASRHGGSVQQEDGGPLPATDARPTEPSEARPHSEDGDISTVRRRDIETEARESHARRRDRMHSVIMGRQTACPARLAGKVRERDRSAPPIRPAPIPRLSHVYRRQWHPHCAARMCERREHASARRTQHSTRTRGSQASLAHAYVNREAQPVNLYLTQRMKWVREGSAGKHG